MALAKSRTIAFIRATAGGIMPLFSILLIPMLGTVAAAVDYAVWLEKKAHLQGVADAAATAGAWAFQTSDDEALAEAQRFISGNARLAVDAEVSVLESGQILRVRLVHEAEPLMSGILSKDAVQIGVAATAQADLHGPACMLALDDDAITGILVQGSANLIANGCPLWSNAKGHNSFRSYPSTTTYSTMICAVGGVYARGTVNPKPKAGCKKQPDPLADWNPEIPPTPCLTSPPTNANSEIVLQPGTYCGGLKLENGNVTLSPGIYVIKDGPFSLRGNVQVKGEGVGIYLTGADARLDFAGNGKLHVTAMKSEPMKGVVIAHDPSALAGEESQVGEESTIIGNFTLSFEGTIYLPNQTFSFWGNSDTAVDPPISHIIANRISVGGHGKLRLRSEPGGGIQPWTQAVNMVRLIE